MEKLPSMNLLPCEAGSLVYDVGSSTIQFGFAGDAQPLFSVPSSACQRPKDGDQYVEFGHTWLQKRFRGVEVTPIVSDLGSLVNSDILSSFFDWTYQACLSVENPTERPVLVTQPSHLAMRDPTAFERWRSSLCEALFDFAGHPGVCLEHDSALACFTHATHTALVLDFGWSCVRTLPVIEGKPLLGSMVLSDIGGRRLCDILESRLVGERQIRTPLDVPDPATGPFPTTDSQRRYYTRVIVQDIIQSCMTFDPKPITEPANPRFEYSLPGPRAINVHDEMYQIFMLFWSQQRPGFPKPRTIHDDLLQAISAKNTPADVRRQLWGNIVVSGGFSNLPGFTNLIEGSFKPQTTPYPVHVLPIRHRLISGSNTVWAGGSILASLDAFPEFCITKKEWQEVGTAVLRSKCL
jgi:actin-related protein